MAEQLSYVLVTPHALYKARLGGIVSRLLSQTGLELEGARLFAPGADRVAHYAATAAEPLYDYLMARLPGQPMALLLLKGDEAVEKVARAVGDFGVRGSIRDTFGDLITDASGQVVFYEPALLAPSTSEVAERDLLFWAEGDGEGDLLPGEAPGEETTLVLIKPDNFENSGGRPGHVIDVFSRAGLDLVGAKVHYMSVAEASEFYGPVLEVLKATMGESEGQARWESLVAFMAGARPSEVTAAERELPGSEKILALIYRGRHAVAEIRKLLGATNPANAAQGTVRREFAQSMMINAAHASDSPENARREIAILNLHENNLKPVVEPFLRHRLSPIPV